MAGKEKLEIPVEVRLNCGNLTIEEVCALAKRSKTGFYEDLKVGLVAIRKIGRKSVVPGPIAKAYLRGEPLPPEALPPVAIMASPQRLRVGRSSKPRLTPSVARGPPA